MLRSQLLFRLEGLRWLSLLLQLLFPRRLCLLVAFGQLVLAVALGVILKLLMMLLLVGLAAKLLTCLLTCLLLLPMSMLLLLTVTIMSPSSCWFLLLLWVLPLLPM